MSTSIDGYRFTPGTDLFAAFQLVRDRLRLAATTHDLREIVGEAIRIVDDEDARGVPRTENPWRVVTRRRHDDRRKGDWPGVSRCHLHLGRDPEDPTQRVYVHINAHADFERALAGLPGIEEFGYTNASDWLPDGVTHDEYQSRLATWSRVMPSGMAVADMLQVQVRDPYESDLRNALRERTTTPGPLLAVAPSTARRARDIAAGLAVRAMCDADPGSSPVDHVGRAMFGTPATVVNAVTSAIDPDLPAAVIAAQHAGDLDRTPAPDLSAARAAAAQWVADDTPENPDPSED